MPLSKEDIKIINVFSIDDKGGNPCAVVDNADSLGPEEMQSLATHLKLPETVYILRKKQNLLLRFFATKKEHPLCYHGALGAAFYLCKLQGLNKIDLASYHNHTWLKIRCENNSVSMSIPHKGQFLKGIIYTEAACKLLNINKAIIDQNLPCVVFSLEHLKLFVPIKDRKSLFNITPQLRRITKWSKDNNVNGIYAYSRDTEHYDTDFVARSFNPLFSHQEDIATGTAAAALCQMISLSAPLLNDTFTIEQGANLNSPSKIHVEVSDKMIKIKGHAYFPKNNNKTRKPLCQHDLPSD